MGDGLCERQMSGNSPRREQHGLGHGPLVEGDWLRQVIELIDYLTPY